jgi:aldehyde dehydrogenase (NAD+)
MSKDLGIQTALKELGIMEINPGVCTGKEWIDTSGDVLTSFSPADGSAIAGIKQATRSDYEKVVLKAGEAFKVWRMMPAPKR